ncbi:LysR family transcriptional regulator [Jannaschia sp. 2305UL9-9]|uniref:LysR family transcriptional regulator n=1 Tax=Jannaschia sp. 2305UL9-9 TaxID=3121638 RepID=UPI0035290AD2
MDRLHLMRAFIASAEAGSFTAAADRLGASNKVVSKHVGELEAALGTRLLHRTTRKLSLTDEGRRYLDGARDVLERVAALEADLGPEDGALRGRLRLSAPSTFGDLFMPSLLRGFRARHPNVEIDLRLSDRFVDLAEDGFDLAVRIGSLPDSSLVAKRLARTALWVIASPGFLAAHSTPATPDDLPGLPAIHDANLRTGRAWPFVCDGQTRRVGVSAGIAANSARVVADLARDGAGVALCPDYVVARMVARGELVRLLPEHASLSLDVHVVYLANRHLAPKTRAMIDYLAEWMASTDWPTPSAAS